MVTDGYANRLNGVEFNAVDERRFDSPLLMPGVGGGAFAAKSGRRVNGAGLTVLVGGSPEAWTVTAGAGVIFDTAYASQGAYRFEIPNSVTANLPARPGAGQSRIDLIVARVYDNAAIGSGPTEVKVERVNGTAGATPSAPTLPALSVELARLTVPASGGITITASSERTVAAGGILPVATKAAMEKLKTDSVAYEGMYVDVAATDSAYRFDGTNWLPASAGSDGTSSSAFWGTAYNPLLHRFKTYSDTAVVTPDANGDVTLVSDLTALGFVGVGGPVASPAERTATARQVVVAIGGNALGARLYGGSGTPLTSGEQRINYNVHGWVTA